MSIKIYLIRTVGYLLAVEPWLFLIALILAETDTNIDMSIWQLFGIFNVVVPVSIGFVFLTFLGWGLLFLKVEKD